MSLRKIIIHPDPRLKKVAEPIAEITDDLRALGDDMLETMYDAPGIGLAAPQVGVLERLIVMDCVKEEGEAPQPMIMFNPEVVASSDKCRYAAILYPRHAYTVQPHPEFRRNYVASLIEHRAPGVVPPELIEDAKGKLEMPLDSADLGAQFARFFKEKRL